VAESDLYVGYDSAGQHIAAALSIPTIDIFAGYTSPLVPARWRPHGRGPVSLVTVPDGHDADPKQVLHDVLHHYRELRARVRAQNQTGGILGKLCEPPERSS
jgi:ADP-heptose:LPS heptosyltransferase